MKRVVLGIVMLAALAGALVLRVGERRAWAGYSSGPGAAAYLAAVGTAFSYQGQLRQDGQAVGGAAILSSACGMLPAPAGRWAVRSARMPCQSAAGCSTPAWTSGQAPSPGRRAGWRWACAARQGAAVSAAWEGRPWPRRRMRYTPPRPAAPKMPRPWMGSQAAFTRRASAGLAPPAQPSGRSTPTGRWSANRTRQASLVQRSIAVGVLANTPQLQPAATAWG